MTNLEKLQKASPEELAELLVSCAEYTEESGMVYWTSPYDDMLTRESSKMDFIEWLKEEAE